MPCGATYTIDAYQRFVYIANKKTVSQSGENLVCRRDSLVLYKLDNVSLLASTI